MFLLQNEPLRGSSTPLSIINNYNTGKQNKNVFVDILVLKMHLKPIYQLKIQVADWIEKKYYIDNWKIHLQYVLFFPIFLLN